ncbi:MAG TPA: serine hydrolase, partial [Acidimicrobiales bacterium]|nr:serine hydrolase [Acidimicrobiales bacterium]
MSTDAALEAALDALAVERERFGVPGVEVAAVRDERVLVADAMGVRDLENAKPAGSATRFHHGSCGKAFTGLLAAVL